MRRRTVVIVVIAVAAIVIGSYVAITVLGNNEKTEYLVAQIYISSWNSNTSTMDQMDVQFKISLDLNNDSVYEVQKFSDVMDETYIEIAPYRLGGPIASNLGSFNFKVEVFKVVEGVQIPMNYTEDGSIPVNHGSSTEGSQNSWTYDATVMGYDELACSITYWYYVS